MKIRIFKCDNCNKRTEDIDENFCSSQSLSPMPYESGWLYVHNLNYRDFDGEKELKDKHFCSEKCFLCYLSKMFLEENPEKYVS